MKSWLFASLLGVSSAAFAAQDVEFGCRHLRIALDERITPAMVEEDWGSGTTHEASPATAELVGCDGRLLDRFRLEAPLARIDPKPVKGAPHATYLVTADLTTDAGSYNGPLTILLQVVQDRLDVATARGDDGGAAPIHLTLTGKAAWQRHSTGTADQFLQVDSMPARAGFVTRYRRFFVERKKWTQRTRRRAGLWESDGDFPPVSRFP